MRANLLSLESKTISDAWFQLIYNIFDNSYKQNIQRGSFENEQYRIQYPGISVFIEYPWDNIVPIIPQGLGIPTPTSMDYIEDYFTNYLMDPKLSENETYRYSSRIHETLNPDSKILKFLINKISPRFNRFSKETTQLDTIIKILKETPETNQACIEIGKPSDIYDCYGKDGKLDPPCLRLISFKAIPIEEKRYKLNMSVYFRSWDLWSGFPSNLGGLELLKQYVAAECNFENGHIYAYSDGLHLYGYQKEVAKIRAYK